MKKTLPEFLSRCDLTLHFQEGILFIPVENAHFALTTRQFLQGEFPEYLFLAGHWPVWGYVITVTKIPEKPQPKPAAHIIARERIPQFIDALDVQLAMMIAESCLDE